MYKYHTGVPTPRPPVGVCADYSFLFWLVFGWVYTSCRFPPHVLQCDDGVDNGISSIFRQGEKGEGLFYVLYFFLIFFFFGFVNYCVVELDGILLYIINK
jgi:hypothetical protein